MEQNTDNTSQFFMEITSNKIAKQEKRFDVLEEKLKELAENKTTLIQIMQSIKLWKEDILQSTLPADTLKIFSARLDINSQLLQQVAKNKVQHHHHIPKLIWITAGLFISLALALSGWYATTQKANQFIANDTKYRYLKIDSTQRLIHNYLLHIDSLYKTMPDMRQHVFEEEQRLQENFEKLQKAEALRVEAKNVEKSVKLK